MADISIVNGDYNPTNITGGHHLVGNWYFSPDMNYIYIYISQGWETYGENAWLIWTLVEITGLSKLIMIYWSMIKVVNFKQELNQW